jgi:endoglucanase
MKYFRFFIYTFFLFLLIYCDTPQKQSELVLNELEYLEMPGLNVMLAHDFYPEGHQGGVSIIQNGKRVATNGDIRLEPTPGQWQPIPKVGERQVDKQAQEIWVNMSYPDSSRHMKGFNPIVYPDLYFKYSLKVRPEGKSFKIIIDLEEPLPEDWIGNVGFNMELFPGFLFGKSYYMDGQQGIFPTQANGPVFYDEEGNIQMTPMAKGDKLVVAPELDEQRMAIENLNGDLELIDGRGEHNNGWFVVRSLIQSGATERAVEWLVTPNVIENWTHQPIIQISQVGYHPNQKKVAVIELDGSTTSSMPVSLLRLNKNGEHEEILVESPGIWGEFLRYKYLQFDFSEVKAKGIYQVVYGDLKSEPFQIKNDIFKRHVWQPTLEYYLPVQMCHMRINDRYRVWHDYCHMDDALMAKTNVNHFDGYLQGASTLTKYNSLESVPLLNRGGWHDAGDYDLRVESQIGTVKMLALAMEEFGTAYDQTMVDQENHLVEMHRPDGKNDVQQQIEHGLLSVLGGYEAMGRLYRGIICPTLRQYVLLGDASSMTDNFIFDPTLDSGEVRGNRSGIADDRWVFTEQNPRRELGVAAGLAAASRALPDYNSALSERSLDISKKLWEANLDANPIFQLEAAVELFITTEEQQYREYFIENYEKTG